MLGWSHLQAGVATVDLTVIALAALVHLIKGMFS